MKKINKYKIYAWGCDLEDYRGEGILGLNFLKHLSDIKKQKILAETPENFLLINKQKVSILKKKTKKKINLNIYNSYLTPFVGLYKIWYYYFLKKEVCYVNFLPLWNFIIFVLLPKKTILGPVTGAVYNQDVKNFNSLIRKYLIPFFYKISIKIGILLNIKYLFTTEILKKYIPVSRQYHFYNYNLINYETQNQKKKYKRTIDFVFYYRKYSAHNSDDQIKIVKKIASRGFSVVVVGDHLDNQNVKNLGIVSRKKIFEILKKTKYSINEGTNFFSIFCLDCLACGVKVFFDKTTKVKQNFFPSSFFFEINFRDAIKSSNIIIKQLNNYKNSQISRFNKKLFKLNYNSYFLNN